MQIQELKPKVKRQKRKRVGRGGKRGIYSGRGNKGQKARTNHRLKLKRIGSGLSRHLPKLGGFKSKHPKAQVVDIADLDKEFKSGLIINPQTLKKEDFIKDSNAPVKILEKGKVTKKFIVENCRVSVIVKEAVVKAGGTVKEMVKKTAVIKEAKEAVK